MSTENTGSIQDMIASAAAAVGSAAQPAAAGTDGAAATAAAPAGVTIERHSARTIEGRAKSGSVL